MGFDQRQTNGGKDREGFKNLTLTSNMEAFMGHLEFLDEADIKQFCAVECCLCPSNALALLNNDDGIAKILSL